MTTPTTHTRILGAVATALLAAALLAPAGLAKPVPRPAPTAYPDAFERAVASHQAALGGVAGYRDAGHAQLRSSGSAVYPDAFERALHLRAEPTGTTGGGGDSFDWGLLATFSALGALGTVLGVGTFVAARQRTRIA